MMQDEQEEGKLNLNEQPADGAKSNEELVTQAPSEDQPGDVDHVPAQTLTAPTATTGNPDLPEADDTAGQVSDDSDDETAQDEGDSDGA